MKIAFVGTFCAGKTTLVNHLYDQLSLWTHVHRIPELAREVLAKGYVLNKLATPAVYAYMNTCQAFREAEAALEHPNHIILCDRTLIDQLLYLDELQGWTDEQRLMSQSTCLTALMLLPPDLVVLPDPIKLLDDGVRISKTMSFAEACEFQATLHYNAQQLIVSLKADGFLKDVLYVSGSVSERAETVMQWIRARVPKTTFASTSPTI